MQYITEQFNNEIEALFGTEEALGICFEDEIGKRYNLEEGDLLYQTHKENSPDLTSVFQNGDNATCCTNYARHIFHNLKRKVKIYGFKNEDNPTAKIVINQFHPGGHDFAIIENRWLVDPWVKLVPLKADRVVFDMNIQKDYDYIVTMYGPKSKWRHMVEAENGPY